jgi:AbrB family looped-hinge helix DNA binding protein
MALTKERGAIPMKSETVRFKKKSQVTIPKEFVEALNLKEGDNLQCRLEDGKIVIVPMISVPKDQAWFWSEEWQKEEMEAEEEIKAGRLKSFDNIGDLLKSLHEDSDEISRGDE